MERIAIVGSGGAGKSTLARKLGELLELPVIHLDQLHWRPGWTPTPDAEWESTVRDLASGERWIIDGNYGGTMALRFAAADTIVFLDYPRHICTWRAFKRGFSQRGRSRPDMAPGCPERVDLGFLRWVWSYKARSRPGVLALLRDLPPARRVVILRNGAEAERFVQGLERREHLTT